MSQYYKNMGLSMILACLYLLNACSNYECEEGFKDYGAGDCLPVDPCTHYGTCEMLNRMCANNQGHVECGDCLAGFQDYGDDECKSDPCPNDTSCANRNRKCVNNQGTAECGDCVAGHHEDNGNCVADILCEANTCSQHGTCDDTKGFPVCTCNKEYDGDHCEVCAQGYHDYGDGNCMPIDPCNPNPCSEDYKKKCTNKQGIASCSCDDGYEPNNLGICVWYEHKCDDAGACGGSVLRRECRGNSCEAWSMFQACELDQLCWADHQGAGCTTCELGCADGKCKECETGSGPCCRINGTFKDPYEQCSEWTEYQCLEVCGGTNRLYRVVRKNCAGNSSACDGEVVEHSWIPMDDCNIGQGCEIDDNKIAQCAICGDYSDCLDGICTCHFESCYDSCCGEGLTCLWNKTCGLLFSTEKKLIASDAGVNDYFGKSVSISGDVGVVGAPLNGSGAAYVFHLEDGQWSEKQRLAIFEAHAGDQFGEALSISGNRLIVGAPWSNIIAGSYTRDAGAAYIFQFENDQWVKKQRLVASDLQIEAHFGISVSMTGNVVIVGAYAMEGGGAAYIFQLEDGKWKEKQKLTASDAQPGDSFGNSVSISGDKVIIGADGTAEGGAAYIFQLEEGQWNEKQKLTVSASQSDDMFGHSVSISGDIAIIGSVRENGGGAAYIFQQEDSHWVIKQRLIAKDTQDPDEFGYSVSISGNRAIIGARFENGGDGDPLFRAGAAYVFQFENNQWEEKQKIVSSDTQAADWFGYSVSISGDTAIVGSFLEDEGGDNSGAAYIY